MNPQLNDMVLPGIGNSLISAPHRVLAINVASDAIWLMPQQRKTADGRRTIVYIPGPKKFPLTTIAKDLEAGRLVVKEVTPPGHWAMTDADYLEHGSPTEKETAQRNYRLSVRQRRYRIIRPILGDAPIHEVVPAASSLRESIVAAAKEHDVERWEIYAWIHLYWASGGCLNSLIPLTPNCGRPGEPKPQKNRLGRKPRLAKTDPTTPAFLLNDQHKERLALGYALVRPGFPIGDAYVATCQAFWSTGKADENGRVKIELLPIGERPTRVQFEYWGRKLSDEASRRRRIGVDRSTTSSPWLSGSTQQQVCAVGQYGVIDSTSTDVYLTSLTSRVKKLPPMHRTVIKDLRSTAIVGFYCGWEDPSQWTALQAILCAADSKVEIYRRFDIEITDEQDLRMLFKNFIADNGEMKGAHLAEAQEHFKFSVEFVRTYSGQSKADVENQHHTDHKHLDHKQPGTTRGKMHQRGEQHPAIDALLNYYEYMREYLLWVLEYNSQEAAHLAPTEMVKRGIRPTRLNIFYWLRDHGYRADLPCNVSQLRAFALPDVEAAVRTNGIHLIMGGSDGKRRVPGHRFFAEALRDERCWQIASQTKGTQYIKVKMDGQNLAKIWLPTGKGLLPLPNVEADETCQREATLTDWLSFTYSEDLHKDHERQSKDQATSDKLLRQTGVNTRAKRELSAEIRKLPKPPSKKSVKANLRQNKADEMDLLAGQANSAAGLSVEKNEKSGAETLAQQPPSAAANAMDAFLLEKN